MIMSIIKNKQNFNNIKHNIGYDFMSKNVYYQKEPKKQRWNILLKN